MTIRGLAGRVGMTIEDDVSTHDFCYPRLDKLANPLEGGGLSGASLKGVGFADDLVLHGPFAAHGSRDVEHKERDGVGNHLQRGTNERQDTFTESETGLTLILAMRHPPTRMLGWQGGGRKVRVGLLVAPHCAATERFFVHGPLLLAKK